ncbi:hypothetical protein J6590_069380, partial [Homalodisca vitripennis]
STSQKQIVHRVLELTDTERLYKPTDSHKPETRREAYRRLVIKRTKFPGSESS